jgi:hypothetical protein
METRRTARRRGRAALAVLLGLLVATHAWPTDHEAPLGPAEVTLLAEPVALDEDRPDERRAGRLIFLGGWHLRSRDVRFGGISSMHVEKGEVLAVSDGGALFRFPVPAAAGTLPLHIERIGRGPGSGRSKSDRDVESMVVDGEHGWLGYEGRNAIWRYRRRDWAFEAAAAPPAMRQWPGQRGPEAMVRLPDGGFLAFAEGEVAADGTTPVLLFEGDPALAATRSIALRYRAPEGFRATDAALLPDGRLLLLNRRFSLLEGWSAVLAIAELRGGVLEPREIARLASPLTVDNMEALSVTQEGGRTVVWIASDDNFTPVLQQTLLLKFALAE